VLFDSLSSPNTGVVGDYDFKPAAYGASFNTGASPLQLTDVSLLLNSTFSLPGDTFTVALGGGTPLADVMFEDGFGLNVGGRPILASVTLPISDLSGTLTVEAFSQLTHITLQSNAFYAIFVTVSEQSAEDGATVGLGHD
jgi:hypothetical protein